MPPDQTSGEVFDLPSPPYTNATVRRAFIVWLHCGQTNKFRDVCNYFHVLEKLEERMPPERRAYSRRHELNLFINRPPSSIYLHIHHPSLYSTTQLNDYFITKVEAIRNDKCVFKLDGFRKICMKDGVTRRQIMQTSRLIRSFCISHYITLDKFLIQFKEYAKRCNLHKNIVNVWMYIQKRLIKDEMIMISNWPTTFSFLDEDDEGPKANSLTNQKRLLRSIDTCPVTLKEINNNPWRVEKDDLRNCSHFKKMNVMKDMRRGGCGDQDNYNL